MNNWNTNAKTTPVLTKTPMCTNCQGRGIEVSQFDDNFGNTIAFAHDCNSCDGMGVIVLHYKACGCGKESWMEKGSTRCKDCFNAELDEYMRKVGIIHV